MYKLTVEFETQAELEEFLAREKPKATRKRTVKAKVQKPVEEKPAVEEIPEDTPAVDDEVARQQAYAELKAFVDPKTRIHGEVVMTQMAKDAKAAAGIEAHKSILNGSLEQIKQVHEEISLAVETFERNKERDTKKTLDL